MTKTLQDLIDESIFISTEYQARLAELTQGAGWDVDFSAPAFTLQTEPPVSLTPYLLGTESAARGSWIWSWQELGHFPAVVVSAAVQAREAGDRLGVEELSTDEQPVAEGLARRLTLAAKAVTGVYAHYPAAAGGVTAWLLLEGPELELPELTVERMMRVIAEALTTDTAVDHNLAVDSYAKLRGAHIEWDTQATCVVTVVDGAQRFWFDDHQISGVEPTEPGVGPDVLADLAADARDRAALLREDRAAAEQTAAQEEAEPRRTAAPAESSEPAVTAQERTTPEETGPIEVPAFVETEHAERPGEPVQPRESQEPAAAYAGAADLPFDQEPSVRDVRPGRVSTTVVPGPEPVRPGVDDAPGLRDQESGEPATDREVVAGPGVPGSAEAEPVVEGEETAEEAGERKKGFFSRFFGL